MISLLSGAYYQMTFNIFPMSVKNYTKHVNEVYTVCYYKRIVIFCIMFNKVRIILLCVSLYLTNIFTFNYKLSNHVLHRCTLVKYLGMSFNSKLFITDHIMSTKIKPSPCQALNCVIVQILMIPSLLNVFIPLPIDLT